jgi:hypothetical protein
MLAVYDVSARNTFDELLKWFKEIDTYCGEGVVKVVVGNKMDKVGYSSSPLCATLRPLGDTERPFAQSSKAMSKHKDPG